MQLFIILALLLFGGKRGAQNLLQEVRPMLESFGGSEMQEALKSADEISQVLSAVNAFTGGGSDNGGQPVGNTVNQKYDTSEGGFPLAPISEIADRDITYSLSKYIAQA